MSSTFSNVMYALLSTFLFVSYIFVLFQIVTDLFRDPELSGGKKALWIIGLLFVPLITALIYVVARGRSMAHRQRLAQQRSEAAAQSYIRDVAGTSSVDQIAKAKSMLDAGAINTEEFVELKHRALATSSAHA